MTSEHLIVIAREVPRECGNLYCKLGALVMSTKTARSMPLQDLVDDANKIAVLCCKAWGHTWNDREPNGKPSPGAVCTRCGMHA